MPVKLTCRAPVLCLKDKFRVESVFRDRLLGLCEEDESFLKNLHDQHYGDEHESPISRYANYVQIAYDEASKELAPSLAKELRVKIEFEPD